MAENADVSDAGSGRRPWQGRDTETTGSDAGPAPRRPIGFLVLLGLFLALASIALVWILLLRKPAPTPYFLTISIGEYNSRHFPNLPYAAQDSELLLRHFPSDSKKQAVTKSKKLLREQLKALEGKATQPLIVHLSALALVRGNTVYLMPGDADPDDEATWLDVREVLEAIQACPAAQKMLILDLAHPLAEPRLGVLSDRVAKTLEENLRKDEPGFHVLCPCSAGQYSWASEAIQCSALAYYLDQGLQGVADANKSGNVSLTELLDYAKPRVDRWAQQNFGVRQEPRLLGKGADFTIAYINEQTPTAQAAPKLDAYPESLKKAWKARDDAWDAGAFQRAPRQLLKLDASLLRDEKRWQRGYVTKTSDDETRDLAQALTKAMNVPRPSYRSLSLAGVRANPALAEALYQMLLAEADPKKSADEHVKKQQGELLKKLQEDKKLDFPHQAAALIDALGRVRQLEPGHYAMANGVLATLRTRPSFEEVLYVKRLADFAKEQDPDTWPRDKIKTIWQAMQARQAVLAALDQEPEFLAWVAAEVEQADQRRRTGEQKLLRGRPSTWDVALNDVQAAKESYEQSRKSLESLQKARVELDRALAHLPAFAQLLGDWPEDDFPAQTTWYDAAAETLVLQAFFANPPAREAASGARPDAKLNVHARKLKDHLDELDEMLDLRIRAAEKDATGKTQRALLCLLASPLIKSSKRAELADKQRRLAVKLHEATDKLDQEGALRPSDTPVKTVERDAALTRAKMSIALLRLASAKPPALPADQAQLTPRDVDALEKALHAAWGNELLERWRAAKPSHEADALNRLVSVWDWHAKLGADRDVSLLLQNGQRRSYLQWLAAGYQAEGRFLETNKFDHPVRDFYLDAAENLRLHVSGPD